MLSKATIGGSQMTSLITRPFLELMSMLNFFKIISPLTDEKETLEVYVYRHHKHKGPLQR